MAYTLSYTYTIIDKMSPVLDKIARQQAIIESKTSRYSEKANQAYQRVNKNLQNVERQYKETGAAATRAHTRMNQSMDFGDIAGRGLAIYGMASAMLAPIKAASNFEKAMAGVFKVIDTDGPQERLAITNDILDKARTVALSQADIAAIYQMGGMLGVAKDDLSEFSTMSAQAAVAFNMSADASATAFAKLGAIFDKPILAMREMGDAVNILGNTMATSEREIIEGMMSGGGAGAKAMGLNEFQASALIATFNALGLSATESGTRISVMARNLMDNSKTTELLGKGFTNLMKSDPQLAILKLLDAIKAGKIPFEAQKELLGLYVNDFSLLASKTDMYRGALEKATDSQMRSGAMLKEYNVQAGTTSNRFQLLSNRVAELAIRIGTALLPSVNALMSAFIFLITPITYLATNFPTLTKVIGIAAGVLIGLRVVTLLATAANWLFNFSALATAASATKAAIANMYLQYSMLRLRGATIAAALSQVFMFNAVNPLMNALMAFARFTKIATVVQWAFNVAMTANPIGVVIMGIAALAAAIGGIIYYWDTLIGWIKTAWEWLGKFLGLMDDVETKTAATVSGVSQTASNANGAALAMPSSGALPSPESLAALSANAAMPEMPAMAMMEPMAGTLDVNISLDGGSKDMVSGITVKKRDMSNLGVNAAVMP